MHRAFPNGESESILRRGNLQLSSLADSTHRRNFICEWRDDEYPRTNECPHSRIARMQIPRGCRTVTHAARTAGDASAAP